MKRGFLFVGVMGPRMSLNTDLEKVFKSYTNQVENIKKKNEHILYLDCNNLYGSAQCLPMPLNNFQWVEVDMIDRIENFFTKRATDFNRGVPTQSWDSYFGVGEKSTGYFIECDLNFTDKCKSKLIDFPPVNG